MESHRETHGTAEVAARFMRMTNQHWAHGFSQICDSFFTYFIATVEILEMGMFCLAARIWTMQTMQTMQTTRNETDLADLGD
jgi:hypothetical protein